MCCWIPVPSVVWISAPDLQLCLLFFFDGVLLSVMLSLVGTLGSVDCGFGRPVVLVRVQLLFSWWVSRGVAPGFLVPLLLRCVVLLVVVQCRTAMIDRSDQKRWRHFWIDVAVFQSYPSSLLRPVGCCRH